LAESDKPRQPVERLTLDSLRAEVFANRAELGVAAGMAVGQRLREVLGRQPQARMIFASAPSQNEFLAELRRQPGIDWERVTAFHLDEYVGLSADAPQSFSRFLVTGLFQHVRPAAFHLLDGQAADARAECQRYAALLAEAPIDILCCGIGENGHLAFNDPPVANFADPLRVKVVALTLASREQQVHDGTFPNLAAVPQQAFTLTIPALLSAEQVHCIVPGTSKAAAVRDTLLGPISTACPASVLRRHPAAWLYVDLDSAALYRAGRG
jgi:glucosamine-6-phosphate deaminase